MLLCRHVGIIPYLKKRYENSSSDLVRGEVEKYMDFIPCPDCNGARLKPLALAVKLTINQSMTFVQCLLMSVMTLYQGCFLTLSEYHIAIVKQLLAEIRERLKFLLDVGLSYLTLSRMAGTLSGGESQRIRLATQIGSGLSGVLYVLDEPSIGLHQLNNQQLLNTLFRLRNLGNTL